MPVTGDRVEPKTYSRKFLRIKPESPLYGAVSIVRIGERRVYSGTARVRLLDISPGGLRFVSVLKLPADSLVILEVELNINGLQYCIQGRIVYSCSTEVNEFEYGFRFLEPNYDLRETLKIVFNRMSVRKNRRIIILKLN